jgi:hypothetical protein
MRRALLAALFALPLAALAQRAEVPYLTGRVVDNAEILKPETRRRLADELQAHEKKTANQIGVLTVPTIHGESVEEYAVRVFEQWKLGQKGKDNGVLVLVVPQDRRMRIEVGYGLEGTFTDAAASRIVRDVMTPRFRSGDYDGSKGREPPRATPPNRRRGSRSSSRRPRCRCPRKCWSGRSSSASSGSSLSSASLHRAWDGSCTSS